MLIIDLDVFFMNEWQKKAKKVNTFINREEVSMGKKIFLGIIF